MIWIYVGMGAVIILLLAVIGWLKRICYVMIEIWRGILTQEEGVNLTTVDLFLLVRLEQMVSKDLAKRWYTLTRGEK